MYRYYTRTANGKSNRTRFEVRGKPEFEAGVYLEFLSKVLGRGGGQNGVFSIPGGGNSHVKATL
jgi:hypothetical protein